MKTLATIVGAALALALVSGPAMAGPIGLYAYDGKGKLAKAGKYSRWTRIYKPSDVKKLKARTRKLYGTKMTLCKQPYHTKKLHKAWIAAHKKAGHKIRLRERVAKRKMKVLCTV